MLAIVNGLIDPDETVREAAIGIFLGWDAPSLSLPDAVSAIHAALCDPDRRVRCVCVRVRALALCTCVSVYAYLPVCLLLGARVRLHFSCVLDSVFSGACTLRRVVFVALMYIAL